MLSVILSRSTSVNFIKSTSSRATPNGAYTHTSRSAFSHWPHGSGDQIDSQWNRLRRWHGIALRAGAPALEWLRQRRPEDAWLPHNRASAYHFRNSSLPPRLACPSGFARPPLRYVASLGPFLPVFGPPPICSCFSILQNGLRPAPILAHNVPHRATCEAGQGIDKPADPR